MKKVVVLSIFALSGCIPLIIEYPDYELFDACRKNCEQLYSLDAVPVCLLGYDENQINAFLGRINDRIKATPLPADSCGCLKSTIPGSNHRIDTEVVFTNNEAAASAVAKVVGEVSAFDTFDKCASGVSFPVIFPVVSDPEWDPLDRGHTVFPIQRYVEQARLVSYNRIAVKGSVGWNYLNNRHGIVSVWYGNFLIETRTPCRALDITIPKFDFGSSASTYDRDRGMVNFLEVNSGRVNQCEINSIYEVPSNDTMLALTRIAETKNPNSWAVRRDE